MKIEIYNEERQEEEPLRLRLEKTSRGITVRAVDKRGDNRNNGKLVSITESGDIYVHHAVSRELGLNTGFLGKLNVR